MWPIGFAGGAYLLLEAWCRVTGRRPGEMTVLIVIVASQLPDLFDKPLAWYIAVLPTGRSLVHSLLVVVPLCLLVGVVALRQERPEWGIAFGIGTLSHLMLDALPVLWHDSQSVQWLLYPALPVPPYPEGPPSVVGLFLRSLGDPYFYTEFVLFALAFSAWQARGYPGVRFVRRRFRDRAAG